MLIEKVWFDTAEFLTVVDLDSDVVVERADGCSLIKKNIFCPFEKFVIAWYCPIPTRQLPLSHRTLCCANRFDCFRRQTQNNQ